LPIATGRKLGPYEVVSLLGSGGMGEVYKARDARLGRDVAIKVLSNSIANESERLKRFEQEARAVAALNHPNILTIYEIETHDGNPYLVSELLEGETLQHRLRDGALGVRKALDIAVQAANGVAAAHDKGIIHRDLKPANIFITADGRVKILDFGLAKLTQPETSPDVTQTNAPEAGPVTEEGVVLGTVGYMSPEQVRGKPADARSDIFALGTILYEMLSGKRAFQRDSSADTMAAILKDDPPELAGEGKPIPPAVDRVVRHALEKNPAQRFQSACDFAFDLESLSSLSGPGSGTAAARAQAAEEAAARSMGRRLGFVIAAVALASIAGAAGWLIARQSHAATPDFTRLTFRRGFIVSAQFMPDEQSFLYTAAWDGAPAEVYEQRLDNPEARVIGLPPKTQILSVSPTGQLVVLLHQHVAGPFQYAGTLAEVPASGVAPRELSDDIAAADWGPDGKQLAIVRYSQTAETLEFPIGKLLYKSSAWMGDPRVAPDGQHIAFVDHDDNSDDGGAIAVVDLAGNKKDLTPRWSSARGLAWRGNEIYFTATVTGAARALYAVTLDGRQRSIAASPGSMTLFDVAKDGRALFTQNDERMEMAVVGVHSDAPPRALGWLDWSLVTDITPDGKTVVFGESGEGAGPLYGTYIRKTDGSPAIRLGDGGAGALSPDGKWVASPDGYGTGMPGVNILPVGVGQPRRLADADIRGLTLNWSADSRSVIYTHMENDGHFRVYSESIDGTNRKPITPPDESYGPARGGVSPDGKFLLALRYSDQTTMLIPLDGSGPPRPVPSIHEGEYARHWSSDGKSVFLQTRGDLESGSQVIKLNLATGKREVIKTILPADRAGFAGNDGELVSSDGSTIAFSYSRTLSTLYVLQPAK
jgi:Tol biopolymer transport system component